ncbi:MAG TPA: DUF305 domain-containing protein [Caldilineaceae bacterium]|nr:DUF305 domain-containing protein [Caldilineaceae bacterium]
MSKHLRRPLFGIAFAVVLSLVSLIALAGSLTLAAPSQTPSVSVTRQESQGATSVTDTASVTGTEEHLLHHPEGTSAVTRTVSVPTMMGMMGEMMTMMGEMQGMMGMMGQPMMGSMAMTGTLPMTGAFAMSDCLMIGPMLSMMGSMMSMLGSMQTLQGMMLGHGGMMEDMSMMGSGMMVGEAVTGTMPMTGAMPMMGMMPMTGTRMGMGMMGGAETIFMLDHMMQMMGQMRAMVTLCQQMGQAQAGQDFDLGFIDGMIAHHEGAIAMAEQALEEAEHDEIRQMAQAIIDAQQAEIAQLQEWRMTWYPDAAPTRGLGMEMGMMEIAEGEEPFDLRFIDAMISHHQGAIAMAQAALTSAQHDEIRQMAQDIIDAQQAEIDQLAEWRDAWYPDAE